MDLTIIKVLIQCVFVCVRVVWSLEEVANVLPVCLWFDASSGGNISCGDFYFFSLPTSSYVTYFDRSDPRKITAFKQIGTFNLCVKIPFVLFFSCLARWCVLTCLQLIALSCRQMTGTLTAALIGWLGPQRERRNLFMFSIFYLFCFSAYTSLFWNSIRVMSKEQQDTRYTFNDSR